METTTSECVNCINKQSEIESLKHQRSRAMERVRSFEFKVMETWNYFNQLKNCESQVVFLHGQKVLENHLKELKNLITGD